METEDDSAKLHHEFRGCQSDPKLEDAGPQPFPKGPHFCKFDVPIGGNIKCQFGPVLLPCK